MEINQWTSCQRKTERGTSEHIFCANKYSKLQN